MIVTTPYDHVSHKWAFHIRDPDDDLIEFDSEYKYTSDHDAAEAGQDAIDFNLHWQMMEAAK